MKLFKSYQNTGRALAVCALMAVSMGVNAEILGTQATVWDLYAKQAQISTPDGDSFQIWAFAESAGGAAQYPGPTMIVDEGDTVTVTLYNDDVSQQDVSLVFPGQGNVNKDCDIGFVPTVTGCHTTFADGNNVVAAGGTQSITYTFVAGKPGTYMYHSGVSPQVQIDMGLVGTLIVRAADSPDGCNIVTEEEPNPPACLAYNNVGTSTDNGTDYEDEFLFFMSEMDPKLHYMAENNTLDQWDNASYKPVLWFINGRNMPDSLAGNNIPQLPHQPLTSIIVMQPGKRILLRTLNPDRHQHPLHTHGNNYDQIARDGNLLTTSGGTALGPINDNTLSMVSGSTADVIFQWTGKNMGWDIYNSAKAHGTCDSGAGLDDAVNNRTGAAVPDGFHDTTWEWCEDHGKELPVVIPENQDLAFGGFWGGSPYLGDTGALPIGEGGLNPGGAMIFMWHSHSEKELANNDVFPGGMITLAVVVPR